MHIQTFIVEAAVKGFTIRVIRWFARAGKVQRNLRLIGPFVQRFADELAAIVDLDALRGDAQCLLQAAHHGHHVFSFQRLPDGTDG